MRFSALLLAALLSSASGGHGTLFHPGGRPGVFASVDSLALCGRFDASLDGLLAILDSEPGLRAEGLYRLVGLFHSCGREGEGAILLDSLENAWGVVLDGFRISLMDLADDPGAAAAGVSDPYLLSYLYGTYSPAPSIRTPASPAEMLVRLLMAPAGSLTPEQMKVCADLAVTFPDAASRLAEEMHRKLLIPDEVWERDVAALRAAGLGEKADLLEVLRMGATYSLDEARAVAILGSAPRPSGEAALLLAARGSSGIRRSWRLADALASASHTSTLADLISSSTDPVFAAGARMALLRAQSRSTQLLALCDSLGAASATDSLSERAALFRARALRDLGRSAEAWQAYHRFAADWPGHPAAHESAFLAGRYYDSEQQWEQAAGAFRTSIAADGEGRYDESCYWRGGFALLASGDARGALALWREGCEAFPHGFWRDEMLYWSARANPPGSPDRAALLEQVSSEHPWEYYGLLASAKLRGQPFWSPEYPSIDPPSEAMLLVASGYGRLASDVLRRSALPDTVARIAGLSLLGEHKEAIELCGAFDSRLRYSGAGVVPDSIAIYQFPAPYSDLVVSLTRDLSPRPSVITAVMREESSFDHRARSSAGACGLIQLMPGTARDVARWYGLPSIAGEQLFDPANSIRYGSLYISRQWNSYSGELPLVLAAYNAGPGNASRWRESLSYSPSDQEWFIERITYRETREYVKRVTRSCWVYGRLMP